MRGAQTARRVAGAVAAAAVLAGSASGSAEAFIGPACGARLVAAGPGASGSCNFNSEGRTTIAVATDRVLTATVRCYWYPYGFETSRTVYDRATFTVSASGSCSLILTAGEFGADAVGVAASGTEPMIDPHPVP